MRRGSEIGGYLQPSENTGAYSLGAEIIYDLDASVFCEDGAAALRKRTVQLLESSHLQDRRAKSKINQLFNENDRLSAALYLKRHVMPLQRDILRWTASASDRDIELFCRWNLLRTHHLTKALQRDKQELIDHSLEKTHTLTDIGLFPPGAISAMTSATKRYQLEGIDSFHSGGHNWMGMCTMDTIYLANLYKSRHFMRSPSAHMKRTAFHEYLHGTGFDQGGFFNGIREVSPVPVRILEESFVEHATTVAHSLNLQRPHAIDPFERLNGFDGGGIYREERSFLSRTMDHTGITWEQLSESYFLPRGDERGEFIREDIERKIGKFFGTIICFYEFLDDYNKTSGDERTLLMRDKITELTTPAAA